MQRKLWTCSSKEYNKPQAQKHEENQTTKDISESNC